MALAATKLLLFFFFVAVTGFNIPFFPFSSLRLPYVSILSLYLRTPIFSPFFFFLCCLCLYAASPWLH